MSWVRIRVVDGSQSGLTWVGPSILCILLDMSLYDFRCKNCQHAFEALVRSHDTGSPRCPSCGGQDLERLLSSFAVDTADLRQKAAHDSRRRQIAKRRDSYIAEEEYRNKHDKE